MDRPTIIGIADGPMHPESEMVRKLDFVLFGDWPSTFEPHRVAAITPTNWRRSPLVVTKETVGTRKLTGVQVFWGPDNKELANLITMPGSYSCKLVVITKIGDGSASKVAKKLGIFIETIAAGRLAMVSCLHGGVFISYESDQKLQKQKKDKVKPKLKPKEIILEKEIETVVVVKTKAGSENDNK